ncbi:MAG: SLAP domain-containing protein [Lactobacillus sp.]|nr:SLAP domain-containing protein [Lactobacillus sp.]
MKKSSLMSASVVAAALLAIAPIAAPAVNLTSTTPVAQAADTNIVEQALQRIRNSFKSDIITPDWASYITAISKFSSVENPTYIFDKDVSGSFSTKFDDKEYHSAEINETALSTIFQKNSNLTLNPDEDKALVDGKIKFTSEIVLKDDDGSLLLNNSNKSISLNPGAFEQRALNAINKNGSLTLTYKFFDASDKQIGSPVVVKLTPDNYPVKITNAIATIYPKTQTAVIGDKIETFLPSEDFDDIHFLDESGNDITDQLKGYIDLSRDIKDSKGNVVTGDKFTQPGDYTRAVTIDFKTLMGTKQFDDDGNPIKVGDPNVYNYTKALKDGKIKVILNGKEIILKDGVDGFDAANGKYTYNRKITVTGEPAKDADKKDKDVVTDKESISGVVTVKNNVASSVAQLFDSKGRAIIDRALPTNSSWKTDYRVKINGITYYRVSTDEFVRADRVNFLDNAAAKINVGTISGNLSKSYINNIFKVNGIGLTALWRISNDGQSMIVKEDRWVPQDSRWFTDQKVDLNGVTFYRLSTNEWIKANNGYLEK